MHIQYSIQGFITENSPQLQYHPRFQFGATAIIRGIITSSFSESDIYLDALNTIFYDGVHYN
jgi:hypothetical protein